MYPLLGRRSRVDQTVMLQPQNYPKMIGQSLVFEPEPAVIMVDDDNPWVEGLFFILVIGFIVALAQVIGGVLLTASLPDRNAMLEAILQVIEQSRPVGMSVAELSAFEESLRLWWPWLTGFYQFGNGWARLLTLIITPVALIAQWMLYGMLCHLMAKALGGRATIAQTMGVTALGMAPRVLLLAMGVPFVSVGSLLLQAWGVLIAYRGLEVAHGFGVRKAATTALFPVFVLVIVSFVGAAMGAAFVAWVGGA